ncbi:MAG: hypothetical protein LBC82_00990, partial [Oscillospiraceae bacterium]|nr:hypothetical protein [Oscillospiraceae bacterium]
MNTSSKINKPRLAIIGGVLVFISVLIAFSTWLVATQKWTVPLGWFNSVIPPSGVNQVSYEYTGLNRRVAVFGEPGWLTRNELDNRGYAVSFPEFQGSSPQNRERFVLVHTVLTTPGWNYAQEIIDKYRNCAVLDFEVETVKNETLTISFYGYGYPDLGEGEPVSLDRVFIFDISSVSAD